MTILSRHRNLRNKQGVEGRLKRISNTVTALVREERIEVSYQRGDEARAYLERVCIYWGRTRVEFLENSSLTTVLTKGAFIAVYALVAYIAYIATQKNLSFYSDVWCTSQKLGSSDDKNPQLNKFKIENSRFLTVICINF